MSGGTEWSSRDILETAAYGALGALTVALLPWSGWPKVMLIGAVMGGIWLVGSIYERSKNRRRAS